jgi:hypothetical protein
MVRSEGARCAENRGQRRRLQLDIDDSEWLSLGAADLILLETDGGRTIEERGF